MARAFTMGIRLNYSDNSFSKGIREATRNTNGFRDSLHSASNASDGFISKLGGIAAALGGIAAGKKAFDWLVGANANLEQYQNTLTVVFKSQEKAIETLEWANKFAKATPFEIPEIVEATTRLAAYGMEAQKVLGITGDMASVMGKDLMQAVEAIADAQTGELERLKEFGITKKMIEEQAKLLGSNPIDNKGSITDMKAFNAALFSLMEERYTGGMEMQSKTFIGLQAKAKDFINTVGRQLGAPIFDKLRDNMTRFMNTLDQLEQSGAVDAFIKKVHRAGAVIWNVFSTALSSAKWAFTGIWNIAAPVIDFLRKNWEDIKPYILGVAIAIGAVAGAMTIMRTATMAATIAMRLLNASMLLNPVGWIVLGIGLLIGLFIKLNGGVEGTKQKMAGWFNKLKAWYNSDGTQAWVQKVITFFQQLAAKAGQAFSWLKAQAKTYWPVIQAAIVTAFDYVKTNVLPILKQLLTVAGQTFKQIWAVAKPFGAALLNFFVAIAPSIWGLVKGIAWVVMNILWPALKVIWTVVAGIAAAVIPVVVSIFSSIVKAFTAVLKWASVIWPMVAKIIGGVFNFIKLVWTLIGPFIMTALKVIGGIITGGFKVIMAVVKFVWDTISGIIKVAWSVISGLIQTALGLLTGDWQKAWDGFKSIFDGVWKGITDFLGGVGKLFYDSGKAIMQTLVDGIKAVASAPVDAVKGALGKVRDLLPFSDAKKGPLSELTYSGGAIMTTLATGVNKQAGTLQDAVNGAFTASALGMDMSAQVAAVAAPAAFTATPSAAFSAAGTNIAPSQVSAVAAPSAQSNGASITIGSLVDKIELHATKDVDADSLVDQFIDRLHARAKDAAAILSSANKGALV